jgi:hypothetical protein
VLSAAGDSENATRNVGSAIAGVGTDANAEVVVTDAARIVHVIYDVASTGIGTMVPDKDAG